jgi:hypothetical protein
VKTAKLITETSYRIELNESASANPYVVGIFSTVENINENGRTYSKDLFEREYNKIIPKVKQKNLWGELGHSEKASIDPERIAILIEHLEWKGNDVYGKAKILDTPLGNIAKTLVKEGSIGISSKGLGTVNEDGQVNEDFNLISWDLVIDPSNQTSWVKGIYEGKEFPIIDTTTVKKDTVIEEPEINIDEAKEFYKKHIWQVIEKIEKNI